MNLHSLPTRDTPRQITAEITRYGGMNPFGEPSWRVVLAQNVKEQTFGTMRHMPLIDVDAVDDVPEVNPESFSSGEMWVPRYNEAGWILERWFPAHAWGTQAEWESEKAEDEVTQLKGEFPRHGDYFMVNDGYWKQMQSTDFWKLEIQKCLRDQEAMPGDPATVLGRNLYMHRAKQEQKEEDYREEVNRIHRSVVDPMLATIGKTAQCLRDGIRAENGYQFHLSAG
jgi:hypothetical protein